MRTTLPTPEAHDIPSQVIEAFLATLAERGIGADVIERLRKTLLEDKDFSDRALRAAVAPGETLP